MNVSVLRTLYILKKIMKLLIISFYYFILIILLRFFVNIKIYNLNYISWQINIKIKVNFEFYFGDKKNIIYHINIQNKLIYKL